jgi:hypothetical protein
LAANAYSIGCYYNDTFVEYGKMHRVRNLVIVIVVYYLQVKMIWLAVIVVNQNDLVGCYISVSVRSVQRIGQSFPISATCHASQHADGNANVLLALDCSTPSKEHVL